MSYTVGVKRRFWFGFKEYQVKRHAWENGRFILNLDDGSQMHVPGFSTSGLKVYPDFWIHLHQLERERAQRPAAEEAVAQPPMPPPPVQRQVIHQVAEEPSVPVQQQVPPPRQRAIAPDDFQAQYEQYEQPAPKPYVSPEAARRANQRVSSILEGFTESGPLASGPN